ncbi:alpha-ketoacid dehydrogenase subunit beta [Capillimicrobium parvum]|uniref:2-oxoisovalerate dehydrogenase subunit beta n=1 Tax=Capillimicrobium parvum TaxID=2884022 RepID=A0A9E6XW86_9ACTN|nr:2-oxoisovalerate dehydrogenase subunit beta [Capillimicrobium parvum]
MLKEWQAVNEALREEMELDGRVVVFGEDLAKAGGTFGQTRGLLDRFGPERVRDTPISEQAMVGAAVGAAMAGLRPVVEILYIDFLGIASDPLVNQAAKVEYFTAGALNAPMVVKSGVGTLQGMGAQHTQALEGWYAQVPGLKVCWPATPGDAKGLLKAAIRDDAPVLYIESFDLLRARGPVLEGEESFVPLGVADVVRRGRDLTLVTWGTMRRIALEAAEELASRHAIEVEVIDLRTIYPWDRATVFESVAATHRCLVATEAVRDFGPGGEIAAEVGEACFDDLDAPVTRLGSPRVPSPHFKEYEAVRLPSKDQMTDVIAAMVGGDLAQEATG